MSPGTARFIWKTVLYGGVAAACIGWYVATNPDAFVQLPDGRDPGLAGDWYSGGRTYYRHFRFNLDGTGQIWTGRREPRDFRWGSDGDRIRMKYRIYNGWTAPKFEFHVGEGGQSLSLHGLSDFADSAELQREPPPSAKLE